VLGCGGTRLETAGGVFRETVWNDGPGSAGGGGVSRLFTVPNYQTSVPLPRSANPGHRAGRVVPDVSGVADPETGFIIVGPSGDFEGPIGGTSATAPLWAALIARVNQAIGRPVGFLNPILYKFMASGVLRDITTGDNGMYAAGVGYDACTGLGSIDGVQLLQAFAALGGGLAVPSPRPQAPAPAAAPQPRNGGVESSGGDGRAALESIERQLAAEIAKREQLSAMLESLVAALRQRGLV